MERFALFKDRAQHIKAHMAASFTIKEDSSRRKFVGALAAATPLLTSPLQTLEQAVTVFSSTDSIKSSSLNIQAASVVEQTHPLPNFQEADMAYKPVEIFYADGLGGRGIETRAFTLPIRRGADTYLVPYHNVVPSNPDNPNEHEWTQMFVERLSQQAAANKETILLGYSMGVREIIRTLAYIVTHQDIPEVAAIIPSIRGIVLAAGRANDVSNIRNHPELSNYVLFFTDDPSEVHPKNNVSDETMNKIKDTFVGKIEVFHETGDTVIPIAQGSHLAEQLGVRLQPQVTTDNHYGSTESGIPLAEAVTELIQMSRAAQQTVKKKSSTPPTP